jgi:lysophospholipase L1-like esterase
MSISSRIRMRLLVCCVASATAVGALVFAPAAGAFKVGSTYLALGDSYAYGYHQAQFLEEIKSKGFIEPATFNDGYVDDFAAALKAANPSLQVINDGCPGETSDAFIKGSGEPGRCADFPAAFHWPDAFLHHPYFGTQLEDAEAVLKANPTGVSPITLDIGGNDALKACGPPKTCTEAEIAALYKHIGENVAFILGQLRKAAPTAQIVLLGYFNPFPLVVPDKATAALNGALAAAAAAVPGTSFGNPLPLFNPSVLTGGPETQDIPTICAFTGMCPGGTYNPASPQADIHPSKLGYAVLAGVVGASFITH